MATARSGTESRGPEHDGARATVVAAAAATRASACTRAAPPRRLGRRTRLTSRLRREDAECPPGW